MCTGACEHDCRTCTWILAGTPLHYVSGGRCVTSKILLQGPELLQAQMFYTKRIQGGLKRDTESCVASDEFGNAALSVCVWTPMFAVRIFRRCVCKVWSTIGSSCLVEFLQEDISCRMASPTLEGGHGVLIWVEAGFCRHDLCLNTCHACFGRSVPKRAKSSKGTERLLVVPEGLLCLLLLLKKVQIRI